MALGDPPATPRGPRPPPIPTTPPSSHLNPPPSQQSPCPGTLRKWIEDVVETLNLHYQYDWRSSRANLDENAPAALGRHLAGGENARQGSLQRCRHAPCCSSQDEKGVKTPNLHYQYGRRRRRANLAGSAGALPVVSWSRPKTPRGALCLRNDLS